jgi:cytochrome c oxidase subunit 4
MSSAAPAVSAHLPAPDEAHAHPSRFHTYVQIAMTLSVITGIEILVVFMKFMPNWLVVGILVLLSAVKFLFVIFFFMHLRWDKVFCTILFFIGLVLGGGTMAALLTLFRMSASIPLTYQP